MIPRLVSILPTEMSSYKKLNSSNFCSGMSSEKGSGRLGPRLLLPTLLAFLTHPEYALRGPIGRLSRSAIMAMLFSHCVRSSFRRFDFIPKDFRALFILGSISRRESSVVVSNANQTLNSKSERKPGNVKANSNSTGEKVPQMNLTRRYFNKAVLLTFERTCQKDSLRVSSDEDETAKNVRERESLLFIPFPNLNCILFRVSTGFNFFARLIFPRRVEPASGYR